MPILKGPVRFRFRVPEQDVDVLIQGDAEWVNSLREDMGLLDVGWVQPMAATGRTFQGEVESEGDDLDESDGEGQILFYQVHRPTPVEFRLFVESSVKWI